MPLRPEHLARYDMYGEPQRFYTFLKKIFRHVFRKHGFTRITLPIFDEREQALAAYSKDADVILADTVDPEAPEAGYTLKSYSYLAMLRAYHAHFTEESQPVYLYSLEPQFRYLPHRRGIDQYATIAGHVIGEDDPVVDAMLVSIYEDILLGLGLSGRFRIIINCVWNEKEQERYDSELQSFFENKLHLMSDEERTRFDDDPRSVFRMKSEDIVELASIAPKISDFLKKDSREYFSRMSEYLDTLEVSYECDDRYLGALSFFTGPVWRIELVSDGWAREIATGGRYDALAKTVGIPKPISAAGAEMHAGLLVEETARLGIRLRNKDAIHLYIIQLGDDAKKLAIPLNRDAQKRGLNSLLSLGTPSIKVQMKKATQLCTRFVAIIGIMEAKNGICQLKDLRLGTQEEIPLASLVDTVVAGVGENALDFFDPARDLVISDPDPVSE